MSSLTSTRYELLTSPPDMSGPAYKDVLRLLDEAIGYPAPASLYAQTADIPFKASPIAPLPPKKGQAKDVTIGVCLGHARKGDMGARAVNGVYEEQLYEVVIPPVVEKLRADGYKVIVYDNYEGSSYGSAMRWIARKLKEDEVDFAVELHFNAASPSAKGFEFLHWHRSKVGVKAAQDMQDTQAGLTPWQANRGAEPLGDQAHERGVLFTSLPHCPSVIAEYFFGSNSQEVSKYMNGNKPSPTPLLLDVCYRTIKAGAEAIT